MASKQSNPKSKHSAVDAASTPSAETHIKPIEGSETTPAVAKGLLEAVTLDWVVIGWAMPGQGSVKPVEVLIIREGKVLAKTIANKPRPDLAKDLNVQESNCGFEVDLRVLSRHIKLNEGDRLLFGISGEPITLLSNEPIILPEYFIYLGYIGYLDGINEDGWVFGWAVNTDDPKEPIEVYFHIDSTLVGSTRTYLERNDVTHAGYAGERAGFLDILTKHFKTYLLKKGCKLWASFDKRGYAHINGGPIQLTEDQLSSIGRAILRHASQNPGDAALSGEELIQIISGSLLGDDISEKEQNELLQGVVLGSFLEEYDRGMFIFVLDGLEKLTKGALQKSIQIELELFLCLTRMALWRWEDISIDRINSAALSRVTDTEGNRTRNKYGNKVLINILERIYYEASLTLASLRDSEVGMQLADLLNCLVQWCYRLIHNEDLTLALIELNTAEIIGSYQDSRLIQAARLYRHHNRDAKALRILADEIKGETTSWYPYHETAVMIRGLSHRYPAVRQEHISAAITHFVQAETLNPSQSLSEREAWGLLEDYFKQEISTSALIARYENLELAINRRQDMLNFLALQANRLGIAKQVDKRSEKMSACWSRLNDKKLVIWGSRGLYQCFYYRVQEKIDQAKNLGYQIDFMDLSEYSGQDWMRRLMGAGLLIACRIPATFNEIRVFAYARALDIPIVYDIDDLIFDAEAFPPPLSTYAGTIDKDFHRHLALDNPFFETALHLADHCLASTVPLADEIRKHTRTGVDITVLPNLLSQEVYYWASAQASQSVKPPKSKITAESPRTVIFYGSATKAHKQCFYEDCLPSLLEILLKYSEVDLHLVGYFENIPKSLVEAKRIVLNEPTPDYIGYLQLLQEADINLAVLELSRATDCKSEIKWLEAAVFGIPSIVSPTATYRLALQNEETALFAGDNRDWFDQCSRLIDDKALRADIGKKARVLALEKFNPRVGEEILSEVISKFWPMRIKPSKRRILFVNVFCYPQSIGGATRVMESQIRGLQEYYPEEYDIFVLTTHADPDPGRPYGVEQYWHGNVLVTRLHVPAKDWSEAEDGKVKDFCDDFVSVYRFDLIHLHSVQVLTASVVSSAQLAQIPYIITLHDAWWLSRYLFLVDEKGNPVDPNNSLGCDLSAVEDIRKSFERTTILRHDLKKAALVMAVSEKFAKLYRDAGVENVVTHENASEPFEPIPHSRQPHDKLIIGFIGGMSPHKGYHLVRQALEESDLSEFKALIVDHSLDPGETYHTVWGKTDVRFIPKVKQNEIAKLYSEMDILLAPSIWPESYGLVTREAIQAGVWVIASDRGAIGDCVIEGENGNLVDVSNSDALKQALVKLSNEGIPKISAGGATLKVKSCADHIRELVGHYSSVLCRQDN